jgi:hypothetical protein
MVATAGGEHGCPTWMRGAFPLLTVPQAVSFKPGEGQSCGSRAQYSCSCLAQGYPSLLQIAFVPCILQFSRPSAAKGAAAT